MSSVQHVPIPGPKGVPFLGNVYDIDQEMPIRSFELLADQYGNPALTPPQCHVCFFYPFCVSLQSQLALTRSSSH